MNEEEITCGVHKETFMQAACGGAPLHWVVFYYPEDVCPARGQHHEAQYFRTQEAAEEFEKSLQAYDDWSTGQEEPLAVQ